MRLRWGSFAPALRVGFILFLIVGSFPADYLPVHSDLEGSWVWAINHYAHSRWSFGRDINFTYGPLGFLLYPVPLADNVLRAIVFRFATALCFAAVLFFLSRGRGGGLFIFGCALCAALGLGLLPEYRLILIVTAAGALAAERDSPLMLAALALVFGPLALIKFTIGLGALAVVSIACLILWRGRRRAMVFLPILVLAGSLVGSARLATGSWTNAFLWVRASVEIAAGYSEGMSLGPGRTDRWAAMLVVLAVLAPTGWLSFRSRGGLRLLLVTGPLFLAYKAGFVREDAHILAFYSFAVAAAGLQALLAETPGEWAFIGAATILASAVGFGREMYRHYLDLNNFRYAATGARGLHALEMAIHPARTNGDLANSRNLDDEILSPQLRAAIGDQEVALVPSELTFCAANAFRCRPLASLQVYSAYTPWLDRALAAQFSRARGPEAVLVHSLWDVDNRSFVLDVPATWRMLLTNYDAGQPADGRVVILRKRGTPRRLTFIAAGDGVLGYGEWHDVPRVQGWLTARLDAHATFSCRARRLLDRVPATRLQLRHQSGRVDERRILPGMGSEGMLVEPFAAELDELQPLFEGKHRDPVTAVRVLESRYNCYAPIPVHWVEERFE